MKNVLKMIIILVLGSTLFACAVNETATVVVKGNGVTQIIESNSGVLADNLSIGDTHTGYAGDLLKAQVAIKNDSNDTLSFQYKFKWLDKSGFEIAIDGLPWQPIVITPFETKTVQAIAPNASANSFKIMVQN